MTPWHCFHDTLASPYTRCASILVYVLIVSYFVRLYSYEHARTLSFSDALSLYVGTCHAWAYMMSLLRHCSITSSHVHACYGERTARGRYAQSRNHVPRVATRDLASSQPSHPAELLFLLLLVLVVTEWWWCCCCCRCCCNRSGRAWHCVDRPVPPAPRGVFRGIGQVYPSTRSPRCRCAVEA